MTRPDLAPRAGERLGRRRFLQTAAALAAGVAATRRTRTAAAADHSGFDRLRDKPLQIGILLFPAMDQIDFSGPFSVLSRIPNATVHVLAKNRQPVRDHKGLVLTPDLALADAPALDLLQIPGGPGQEAVMDDEPVLALIRDQMAAGRLVFSVCTGALICGAAGILRGRRATTHWAAFDLLHYFGATPVDARVVVDGNLISAAGVTAGIDGALTLAALLRGEPVAQQIQLDIQYAPEPPFHAGTPKTAPADVYKAVAAKYRPLTDARVRTATRISARLAASRE
jgi:cyclohexyl-isocyanide hydratase